MTTAQLPAESLDVGDVLGDEDGVGASCQPCLDRDPAGMTTHHLDHHHTVVGLCGRVKPVDRIGGDLHRRLEAHTQIRTGDVVVDRLRHPYERDPLGGQFAGRAERAVPTNRDETVDAPSGKRGADRLDARERVGSRGPEHRAASSQDAGRARARQLERFVVFQPTPAVAEAEEVVILGQPASDDSANHGVQPGAVSPTGQHAHPHSATPCERVAAGGVSKITPSRWDSGPWAASMNRR